MTTFTTAPGKNDVYDLEVNAISEMELVPAAAGQKGRLIETIYVSASSSAVLTIRIKSGSTVKMILLNAATLSEPVYQITEYPRPLKQGESITVQADTADVFWVSAIIVEELTINGGGK